MTRTLRSACLFIEKLLIAIYLYIVLVTIAVYPQFIPCSVWIHVLLKLSLRKNSLPSCKECGQLTASHCSFLQVCFELRSCSSQGVPSQWRSKTCYKDLLFSTYRGIPPMSNFAVETPVSWWFFASSTWWSDSSSPVLLPRFPSPVLLSNKPFARSFILGTCFWPSWWTWARTALTLYCRW